MEIPSELRSQDFDGKMNEAEENPKELEGQEESFNPKDDQSSNEISAKVRKIVKMIIGPLKLK